MKAASAKAKGRRLQQWVRDRIMDRWPQLRKGDVRSQSMGAGGEDVPLSPFAGDLFPFVMECKNQESLNIWKALKQAEGHAQDGRYPAVVFKRNRTEVYVAFRFDHLLEIMPDTVED